MVTHVDSPKSQNFDGMDISHTKSFNRKGSFEGKAVRAIARFTSLFKGSEFRSHQKQQLGFQTTLLTRRTEKLTNIDHKAVAEQLDNTEYLGNVYNMNLPSSDLLDNAINEITTLVTDIKEESHTSVKDGFKRITERDLNKFLRNTVKCSSTPRALATLQNKVNSAAKEGQITSDKKKAITRAISSQYEKIISNLPKQFQAITQETEKTEETKYAGEIKKLATIHELV